MLYDLWEMLMDFGAMPANPDGPTFDDVANDEELLAIEAEMSNRGLTPPDPAPFQSQDDRILDRAGVTSSDRSFAAGVALLSDADAWALSDALNKRVEVLLEKVSVVHRDLVRRTRG